MHRPRSLLFLDSRPLAVLACLPLMLGSMGCSSLAEKVADHMSVKSLQHEHDITLFEGDLAAFHSCLHNPGGTCNGNAVTALAHTLTSTGATQNPSNPTPPAQAALHSSVASSVARLPAGHPAKLAHSVLGHPALAQAVDLHNHLRGHGSGSLKTSQDGACSSRAHLSVSINDMQDLHDKVTRTTSAGGWKALQQHTSHLLAQSKEGSADHQAKQTAHRKAQFLKTYVEAFFRDGHFVGVDLTLNAADAEADIVKQLEKHGGTKTCQIYNAQAAITAQTNPGTSPSTDCSAMAASIYQSATGSTSNLDHQVMKVAPTNYTSRDGSFSAQVPSLGVDIDPVSPHLVTFSATPDPSGKVDYTHIGTELIRVVLEALFDAHEGLPGVSNSTAVAHQLLPSIPVGNVSAGDMTHITNITNRSAMAVGIVTDRLVQGIGPLSLNNDAIEALINTMVTTSVRKATEKAAWCWYACNLDQDVKALESDAKADIKAKAEEVEAKVKEHAERRSQRHCLSMTVGK